MTPYKRALRSPTAPWLHYVSGWLACLLSCLLPGCVTAGRWDRARCVTDRGEYRHEATIKATPPVPENPEPTTRPTTPPPENPT